MSDLNESALKRHALECSRANRAGRFKRVGADFISEIEAEVESLVRDLRNNRFPVQVNAPLATDENFVKEALVEKLRDAVNQAVARIVQQRVQRQPSVGSTLGRTQ
jgi:hypothetical protein